MSETRLSAPAASVLLFVSLVTSRTSDAAVYSNSIIYVNVGRKKDSWRIKITRINVFDALNFSLFKNV